MIELFLEAIAAPPPGWSGRRRYIAGQLARMAVEAAFLVTMVIAFLALIVITWAATQ